MNQQYVLVIVFSDYNSCWDLMRILGKDPLNKHIDKKANSYWIDEDLEADLSDYSKQF